MAGTAYPKRAIKQNRRTTRAKIGKPAPARKESI